MIIHTIPFFVVLSFLLVLAAGLGAVPSSVDHALPRYLAMFALGALNGHLIFTYYRATETRRETKKQLTLGGALGTPPKGSYNDPERVARRERVRVEMAKTLGEANENARQRALDSLPLMPRREHQNWCHSLPDVWKDPPVPCGPCNCGGA